MNELVFVGLGLNDEKSISLNGLEETKSANTVFMELYTSLMPNFDLERFQDLCKKKVQIVSRQELEEENGKVILQSYVFIGHCKVAGTGCICPRTGRVAII